MLLFHQHEWYRDLQLWSSWCKSTLVEQFQHLYLHKSHSTAETTLVQAATTNQLTTWLLLLVSSPNFIYTVPHIPFPLCKNHRTLRKAKPGCRQCIRRVSPIPSPNHHFCQRWFHRQTVGCSSLTQSHLAANPHLPPPIDFSRRRN